MTEQEITKIALEKAKQNNKAPKVPKAQEAKTEPKTETKPRKLLPLERNLGDRIATLVPWTGKTKKKFKKEFEFVKSEEDIDLEKIIEILVYDQIKEDYLLSDFEIQYLLQELKVLSLGEAITCSSACPECGSENVIKTKESGKFTLNKFPKTYKEWTFKNPSRKDFLKQKNKIKNHEEFNGLSSDADIEVACKITKPNKTSSEILSILEDTPLQELQELMDAFVDASSFYEFKIQKTCTHCHEETLFNVDNISGIFTDLAK